MHMGQTELGNMVLLAPEKFFDMVPREHIWKLMEELEVPSEYMLAISRIYEKVISYVRMSDRLSDFFFQL